MKAIRKRIEVKGSRSKVEDTRRGVQGASSE
jgi:hypothetical protein